MNGSEALSYRINETEIEHVTTATLVVWRTMAKTLETELATERERAQDLAARLDRERLLRREAEAAMVGADAGERWVAFSSAEVQADVTAEIAKLKRERDSWKREHAAAIEDRDYAIALFTLVYEMREHALRGRIANQRGELRRLNVQMKREREPVRMDDDRYRLVRMRDVHGQPVEYMGTPPCGPFPAEERVYPCAKCPKMRTKAEGGNVFTVCEACWDDKPVALRPTLERHARVVYGPLPEYPPEDALPGRRIAECQEVACECAEAVARITETFDATIAAQEKRIAELERENGDLDMFRDEQATLINQLLGQCAEWKARAERAERERDELNAIASDALRKAGHPFPDEWNAAYAIGWFEGERRDVEAARAACRKFLAILEGSES